MALLRIIAGICPLACLTLFLLSIDLPQGKAILGTNCSINGNCTQPNETCDTQHVCVCAEGYYDIDISGGSCESKSDLNGTCYNSNGCNVVRSVCQNGSCQCDVNYYEYNLSCSAKSGLNGTCYNSNGCNVVRSVCQNGSCQCDVNYYEYNLSCSAKSGLNGTCYNSNGCNVVRSVCQNGSCQCDVNYYEYNLSCSAKSGLNGTCYNSNGCNVVSSVCKNGFCQCDLNYYEYNLSCSAKSGLNGTCYNSNGCNVVSSVCKNGFCQCDVNYYEYNSACSAKSGLNGTCYNSNGCNVVSSVCKNGFCQCDLNYYEYNSACSAKSGLNGTCYNSNGCNVVSSVCKNGFCQCDVNYYEYNLSCSAKSGLNGTCYNSNGCNVVSSVCKNGFCQCDVNYYEYNSACSAKSGLNGTCYNSNGCNVVSSVCKNGFCHCDVNYYEHNLACSAKSGLNGTCYNSNGCNVVSSVCKNGFCQCDVNYYEYNSACYAKSGLNGACYNSNGCNVVSSVCNNGLCRCDMNYYEYNLACYANSSLSVQELAVTTVGEDSFQLSWTNPINIAHVSKYQVSWERNQMTPFQDISKTNTSATVSNLTSGAAYTIKVTTFLNDAAIISVSVKRATKPKKPGPINLTRSDVDLDGGTMTIAWSYIGPTNGLDLLFLVELIDTTDSKFIPRSSQSPTTSVTISSDGLKNGYRYNVSITAQSEQYGSSREISGSHTEIIKTKSKAPNPPTGVVCSDIGDTNIVLNWTKPTVPNGDIIKYIVKTYRYPNNDTPVMENNSTLSSTQFEVVGLDPGSYYRFQVHTVNDLTQEEIGAWSPPPYCQTRALMPLAPEKLVLINRTSRSFTISWEQPNKVYGELVGYVLKITNMDNNTCVVEEFTKCTGCTGVFPNQTVIWPSCGHVTTYKSSSSTELNTTRTYIGSFDPDTWYKVTVAGVNTDQLGKITELNVTTLEEVPQKPHNVQVRNITAKTATVEWSINGPRPGKTNYTIIATGIQPAKEKMYTISGYFNRIYEVTDLEEYWNYSVIVQASTSEGKTESDNFTFNTLAGPAGPVDSFNVDKGLGDDMYVTARVSWKLPEDLKRNGPINRFYVQQRENYGNGTSPPEINKTVVNRTDDDTYYYNVTLAVQPEMNYTFMVRAETGNLMGSESFKDYLAPPGPPVNIEKQGVDVVPADKVSANSKTSFRVEINRSFFLNAKNGAIQDKGLICCKDPTCKYDNSTITTSNEMKNMMTYAQAKKSGSNKYRLPETNTTAKEQVSGRRRRATDNTLVYDVGIESCDDLPINQYCNGHLDPGSTYRIIAFVCTRTNCTLSKSYGPFITLSVPSEQEFPVGAVVGGIIGGLAILAFIIVFIFFLRYRSNKGKRARKALDDSNDPSHMENLVKIKKQRPIRLSNFAEYVADYHKDSNLKFSEEYEDLKTLSPQHSHEAADMEENRLKNRFVNILPFDHSRVRLLPIDDVPGSDYINANYLPGFSKTREYIACQGPIPATIDDHWRLIWEQNVRVVVMLTQYKEENRVKCEPYMPLDLKDPKQYGDLVVECLTYSSMNSFEYRTLKIRLGEKERTIKHFHFLSWHDYSANVQFDTMIDFIKKVRSFIQPPDVEGPMIVHCSAGVGRTGTYITIDHVIQHIDKYGPDSTMDIFNFVLKMRENRTTMVQTEQQYIFIHDCIKEYLDRFKTYENQAFSSEDENLYQNTETIELYQNVPFNSTQKTEL